MKRFLPFLIIIVVFGAVLAFGFQLKRSAGSRSTTLPVVSARTAESALMPGADPPHVKGAPDAVVTLEEFGDFECPACGQLYRLLKTVEGQYAGRVKVVFRHFPLPQHRRARQAAQLAEAAGLQGSFWQMHDKLYENRTTWASATDVDAIFLGYAQELGLDLERFNRDQNSEAVRKRVEQDFQRGRSLKIKATPTIYLNGVEVPYSYLKTVKTFTELLDKEMRRNG